MSETANKKQKIAERYKGVDPSLLEVIPAKEVEALDVTDRILKVAAYVRVSTENDEQKSSFELQSNEFTDQIKANPKWEFAGIYSDEGISGTDLTHRKGMLQMIEDAKAGKIDLILTKSIARFARNIVDCLSIIETLKNLNPPVGVKFETDNIYTLDSTGRMILTILASVAEEESHSKSLIMNWSIDKRFSRGLFLTPALLGYDVDDEGNLVINSDEAETVKVIYDLYINGFSNSDIADLLTGYGRRTKTGNVVWNSSTINGIIANERHCGDVLARKTYTPNFLTHKAKKNNNNRTQYRQRDHHEEIVSREVFEAANLLRTARSRHNRPFPVLRVIDQGILKGFVPIDKDWRGFSAEDYQAASQSVTNEYQSEQPMTSGETEWYLPGFQVVRGSFFASIQQPALTIGAGRMRFNTACLKKFEDVEYVELLLNTVRNCIAIRPCDQSNPNAINWGRLKEDRWVVKTLGCKGLAKTLFDITSWKEDEKYRFRGQYMENGDEKLLLFELEEPVTLKTVEEVIVPEGPDAEGKEEIVRTRTIVVYPESWLTTFGDTVSVTTVSVFEQLRYSVEWDVLRPATEFVERSILSAEKMAGLMQEAEKIMEGWSKPNE